MDDIREIRRRQHEAWKKQSEEEEQRRSEEERRRSEEEQRVAEEKQRAIEERTDEQKRKDFYESETKQWLSEGFNDMETGVITEMMYRTQQILKKQSVRKIHAVETVPRMYGVCALTAQDQYYFFDIRLQMDHCSYARAEIPMSPPTLIGTNVTLDPMWWDRLLRYWKMIDPYRHNIYHTSPIKLSLVTFDFEPTTDEQLGSFISDISSPPKLETGLPYELDSYFGALSVALPSAVMDPILNQLVTQTQPLAVELCIPGSASRVFAYVRNPDEHSPPCTVHVPWRLKYLLKAFDNQEIYVRVFTPPSIPKSPTPGFRIIAFVQVETADEDAVKRHLTESINHQRVLFPGQVILVHVPDVFGPIPFMVAQTYVGAERRIRVPAGVVGVYGHGDGMDCVIEAVHDEKISKDVHGFEKYYTYIKNLKQRCVVKCSPPTAHDIAKSIRTQFFQ